VRIAVLLVLVPALATAAPRTGLLAPRTLVAARVVGPMRIDGVLDEPAWASAPSGDRFIQQRPTPGAEARLHTTVRVLYDADALYVGVRLDDPDAAHLQAPIGRRDDENNSDWCFVEIDSRHDRRTAFSFGVNPVGMQVDGVFVDDVNYDSTWNAVWEAAATRDAGGWTVEYRIPFSVFAFHPGAPMTWGLNVYRSNPASGEVSNWSPRTPQLAGVVSLFNDLVIDAAPEARRIDVTPYVLASSADGLRAGADFDLALGSRLALVGTVLPDFGQVEADPAQLNLTSYELFLPERRPFFTEGIDAFRFDTSLPLVSRGDSFVEEAPFYTRRIGRAPQGLVPPDAAAPSASTILGAAKLYGRTEDGWRAGVLVAGTRAADASDGTELAVPEQAAVVRVVKESDSGERSFGMFASGLHRSGDLGLPRDEGVAGLDARVRFDDQTYEVRGFGLASGQLGSAYAIAALAAQPWHDFERADAPRLRLPDGATSLAGSEAGASIAKVGGDLLASFALRGISPGFDDDALGFQRNSDYVLAVATWGRQWFPRTSWLRSWRVGTDNAGLGWSWAGERRAAVVDGVIGAVFGDYSDATLTLQHEASVLSTEWLRGGPALALPPRETIKLSAHTDTNRVTYAGLDAAYAFEPDSGSHDLSLAPALTWRISDHLAGIATLGYDDQVIGWQYIAAAEPWVVGRVHQRTASLALEIDAAISPRLIVQLYAQPFVTLGTYDQYQQVVDAHADAFAPLTAWAFTRSDGVDRSLIASVIARWELRPGSFLTAVWQHHGEATDVVAPFANELGRALTVPGGDVVLVKLAWLFAR
jgi:hypothetical protein